VIRGEASAAAGPPFVFPYMLVQLIVSRRDRMIPTRSPAGNNVVTEPLLQTASRILTVLHAIGESRGATILELHRRCGIPRPTLYRIVETLCTIGYVQRHKDRGYRLTFKVRSLAEGFDDEDWVRDISLPILDELRRKVLWPTELATFEDDSMFLRETTRRDSPLTIDQGRTGLRLPMLTTAHGRCFLAFSEKSVRWQILERLARADPSTGDSREALERQFAQIRQRGYASRYRGADTKTGSMAVPVFYREGVLGSIAITFIASALKPDEVARRYLADLRDAARQIEAAIAKTA
jgi:IclR family mhp operon transcriptional activator